jgi:purine-binding chemotaxis protein CheW
VLASGIVRHVVFRLGRDRYALPLSAIREVVVAPVRYTRVPRAPAPVRGVVNLRGRVVPVIDLAMLLEVARAGERQERIILLELGRRELGLLITEIDGVEAIEKLASPSRGSQAVRGVARLGALAVTVLDPQGVDATVAQAFVSR